MALPPGPRGPALLQSLRLILSPIGFLEHCLGRYGDVFTLRFVGMGDLVYVADTEAVKDIFTGDAHVFHAGEANQVMEPVLGPRSLLLLDEDEHLRERRLLLPPFHGDRVRRYRELVAEIAAAETARWPRGREFPLRPRMQAITLEVILRAVFGIREAERLDRLRTLIPKMLDHGGVIIWMPFLRRDLGPGSPWRRFVRVRAEVDRLLLDEIRRRREVADLDERDDVLSLLLQARGEDGQPMGDGELRDELVTLLLAGHETTATGLAWAFERLTRTQRVMAHLEEAIAADDEEYLDAVVKETLRARPVVYDVARKLAAPATVKGWEVPAGAYVVPSITGIHLLQGVYEEPDEFRPERFLESQPDSYAWIPFGGGRRRCIGAAFAQMEMKVVLREVLLRVTLRAPDPKPEKQKLHNVTLVPAKGARVVVADRPAPQVRAVSVAARSAPDLAQA
jgi:cytochrome P450 family 135